jgi:hypothetical protein
MIMPLIFLFLLRDTGDIKRGLLSAVPNRLFEPALAVVADVDETLGRYVRGIFLECCALGLTILRATSAEDTGRHRGLRHLVVAGGSARGPRPSADPLASQTDQGHRRRAPQE